MEHNQPDGRKTEQDTWLVCSENPGVVTEYDNEGNVVWDYLIKTRVYGAIRLNNGNTLIAPVTASLRLILKKKLCGGKG